MIRTGALALTCAAAAVALAGCDEASANLLTGTAKIQVDGKAVNVSCSGASEHRPTIILLHGGGDALDKFAALQGRLAEKDRVCSYDRLGAGASDQPAGPQTFESTGKVLTGVIDQVAGGGPVVLAGHSLGGLIAGRYAPDHQDKVEGLVLLDATSPSQSADLVEEIPASATGMGPQLRDQTLGILSGQNPEQLSTPDGMVASAGDIPVEIISHGKQYLGAVPEFGPGLERRWTEGQQKWAALSTNSKVSTAANSEHYIHLDEPEVAIQAIQRVADQIAENM
ncbi:alpha/beta fold hydrolase [Amycolatopsis sp. 195334CR]|uniref:alpha/beta fold hydrolase n=1 Tax=Amycolatopsis sp. 195334CR TaxID=2814588 RepID=UPI001A9036CB|nr:alpha/beta fold hydrolase [Amycolatopsis sp. 195334CR]MBN6038262.1 alpha/beta fold hydrolase [Amycolatopsis sp. 195334CR]